jgi:hypothetical protein
VSVDDESSSEEGSDYESGEEVQDVAKSSDKQDAAAKQMKQEPKSQHDSDKVSSKTGHSAGAEHQVSSEDGRRSHDASVKTDEQGSKPKAHSQDEQDVALEENSHRPGDGEASHTEAMDVDSADESLQTDKPAEGQKKAGAKDKKTAKVKENDIK